MDNNFSVLDSATSSSSDFDSILDTGKFFFVKKTYTSVWFCLVHCDHGIKNTSHGEQKGGGSSIHRIQSKSRQQQAGRQAGRQVVERQDFLRSACRNG